jgi:hypothetical protein
VDQAWLKGGCLPSGLTAGKVKKMNSSDVTPEIAERWAKTPVTSRVIVDPITVHETIEGDEENVYVLKRDKARSSHLYLVGLIDQAFQTERINPTSPVSAKDYTKYIEAQPE